MYILGWNNHFYIKYIDIRKSFIKYCSSWMLITPPPPPPWISHALENASVHTISKLEPSPCFPVCQFTTSSRHVLSDVILTHPPSCTVNQGQDHLLFLSKTAANLEGMYIFRKNYCLLLATKRSLEIFSELKEIKQ